MGASPGAAACRCRRRMDTDVDTELAPLSLAAARALFRAPQAEDACWADVHMPDGTVRARGRPERPLLAGGQGPLDLLGELAHGDPHPVPARRPRRAGRE